MNLNSQYLFFSCHQHPNLRHFTGFCPTCLRERLSILDPAACRKINSCSSVKASFESGFDRSRVTSFSSSILEPELRRSKSVSFGHRERLSGSFEPQRRSVSLISHFNNENERVFEVDKGIETKKEIRLSNGSDFACNEAKEVKMSRIKAHTDTEVRRSSGKSSIAASLWSAASRFTRKFQKWRKKQKNSTRGVIMSSKETKSEFNEAFGRRSCDADPRFSLDLGRISFDRPRYSVDEPRFSCDGYLNGRTIPRLNPMGSFAEDPPTHRSNYRILEEEPRISISDDPMMPGGSAQTRDYYLDSSSRKRNIRRSISTARKSISSVDALEIDDLRWTSNSRVSPTSVDYYHALNYAVPGLDLPNLTPNPRRDDRAETLPEMNYRDLGSASSTNPKGSRKSQAWRKVFKLINPQANKDDQTESTSACNKKMFRISSTVDSRRSFHDGDVWNSRNNREENHVHSRKKSDQLVLERSKSARYSPIRGHDGLLRFYLTPLRGSRRNVTNGISKPRSSFSLTKTMLGIY